MSFVKLQKLLTLQIFDQMSMTIHDASHGETIACDI